MNGIKPCTCGDSRPLLASWKYSDPVKLKGVVADLPAERSRAGFFKIVVTA